MKNQIQKFISTYRKTVATSIFCTIFVAALGVAPGPVLADTNAQQQADKYSAQSGDTDNTPNTAPYSTTPTSPSNPVANDQPVSQDFSDKQLKSFAQAQKNVDEARAEMASKLQATQDPQEAMSVREEANEEMLSAVEDAGLTRDEYNTIARAVALDPTIASKVENFR